MPHKSKLTANIIFPWRTVRLQIIFLIICFYRWFLRCVKFFNLETLQFPPLFFCLFVCFSLPLNRSLSFVIFSPVSTRPDQVTMAATAFEHSRRGKVGDLCRALCRRHSYCKICTARRERAIRYERTPASRWHRMQDQNKTMHNNS